MRAFLAWFTFPVFMTAFMGASWWCIHDGLDPKTWIPALTTANFLVLLALEQVLPRRREMSTLRDWQSINDSLHGALTGLLRPVGTSIGLVLLAAASERELFGAPGRFWPSGWPLVPQLVLAHAAVSFASYWVHRSFHEVDRLWWFHALHHDTQQVHVLKSGRFHFVDELVSAIVTPLPLLVLGAPTEVILLRSMWSVFNGSLDHANVAQRFPSWFHYVVSTCGPAQHPPLPRAECPRQQLHRLPALGRAVRHVHPSRPLPAVEFGNVDYVPRNFFRQLWFPFQAQWRKPA
jgi:sterol desaturase/sphingolipid hydroxylase (fatty acid hydroxylase superfamily)